jgi:hypothetical protein
MSKNRSQPLPVADIKQARYSDGHPLDDVQYLECKLILKPDRLRPRKSFLTMESWWQGRRTNLA